MTIGQPFLQQRANRTGPVAIDKADQESGPYTNKYFGHGGGTADAKNDV